VTVGCERSDRVPWLVRDGEVLASAENAVSRRERRTGLLGRDGIDGVLVLRARSVHTFGMRFPIDVALCDRDLRVRRVVTLRRNRLTRPTWRRTVAIEAAAGTFRSWGVSAGDRLELR
jgi:uncharacterized protein